jgi:hypothetical protein
MSFSDSLQIMFRMCVYLYICKHVRWSTTPKEARRRKTDHTDPSRNCGRTDVVRAVKCSPLALGSDYPASVVVSWVPERVGPIGTNMGHEILRLRVDSQMI